MKYFLFILLAALAISCAHSHSKNEGKSDILPRPDTIIVAYAQGRSYNLARAVRSYSKIPKITDSSSKKWDWMVDTMYLVELVATPLDTLRDNLKRPRFDSITHAPILRKAFNTPIHSPLPAYFWPLLPPSDHVLPEPPKN